MLSAAIDFWKTLSWDQISREISERSVRAFERALVIVLTIEVGLSRSIT